MDTIKYKTTRRFLCPHGCGRHFWNASGRTQHVNAIHAAITQSSTSISAPPNEPASDDARSLSDHSVDKDIDMDGPPDDLEDSPPRYPSPDAPDEPENPPPRIHWIHHPFMTGTPCDIDGQYLPAGTPPDARTHSENPYEPFADDVQFRLADFTFRKAELSEARTNELLEIFADAMANAGGEGPFASAKALYTAIDDIPYGSSPWKCFISEPCVNLPESAPVWQTETYEIWYQDPDVVVRNILANPDFVDSFDPSPYIETDRDDMRRWSDYMSGNFAWRHADTIYAEDPSNEGAMVVYIVLGSDKTTVSVGTGNVEYWPLYLSISNLHNSARRGHRNGVVPIGFLAIPKGDRPLKAAMTTPVIRLCSDGHYRQIIYDLGGYIADYPEQVLLTCIVSGWCPKCTALPGELDTPAGRRTQDLTDTLIAELADDRRTLWDNYGVDANVKPFTASFPRADIYEIIMSDILHQVVKGTFKDHLVEWIQEYLVLTHGKDEAGRIMNDVNRRLAVTPEFPGLRHFPHGCRFKQWTGDDSKALMKIFIPAIADYIPAEMTQCVAALIDFTYLIRRNDYDKDTLKSLDIALARFHSLRKVFIETGVLHYWRHIEEFGAPNGLCSSITESQHITAVKRPWRRSSRNRALGQMLLTNQRLDKLYALNMELATVGLAPPGHPPPPDPFEVDAADEGAVDGPVMAEVKLAVTREPVKLYPRNLQLLAERIRQPDLPDLARRFLYDQLRLDGSYFALPPITSKVYVFHSAVASFYAPSDISGIHSLNTVWRDHHAHRDCALVVTDPAQPGFAGLSVVRVFLLFSFTHGSRTFPCALPEHYPGDACTVGHSLETLIRAAHLLPMFGKTKIPRKLEYHHTLDVFKAFYVSNYADHHINEII
ncbi:hypothetical protein CPB85DRAFT_1377935 [Mucidula mucida]|nr:hypothetical protein CPB85DRAFT_1377935 [Mucidula mucida]